MGAVRDVDDAEREPPAGKRGEVSVHGGLLKRRLKCRRAGIGFGRQRYSAQGRSQQEGKSQPERARQRNTAFEGHHCQVHPLNALSPQSVT